MHWRDPHCSRNCVNVSRELTALMSECVELNPCQVQVLWSRHICPRLCGHWRQRSVEKEVSDASGLNPGDVSSSASKDTGLIFHCAADGAKAHYTMHLPAILTHLTHQRTTWISLDGKKGFNFLVKIKIEIFTDGNCPYIQINFKYCTCLFKKNYISHIFIFQNMHK